MNSSIGAEGEPRCGGILRSCIKLSSAFKYGVNAAVSFGRIEKTSEQYSTSNSLESCFNSVAHSSIGGSFWKCKMSIHRLASPAPLRR
jgi:hypothetical protein